MLEGPLKYKNKHLHARIDFEGTYLNYRQRYVQMVYDVGYVYVVEDL